ncbi:dGTP triphosphohydrolase [Actinosynnema sp. NPDC051121]
MNDPESKERQSYKSYDGKPLHPRRPDEPEYPDTDEYRAVFEIDRDRLLYSLAFRRLAGVTQVAAVRERALLHNRLTHSLKVAQIGRRQAQKLLQDKNFECGLDDLARPFLPDIVETAGLAHDLGHPPFGHIAEEVLKVKMRGFGEFEGNAQSFRIVTKLATRREQPVGLDLSRATLNAILKYPRYHRDMPAKGVKEGPWTDRSRGAKWGVYEYEKSDFKHARERQDDLDYGQVRSVAAILMDWADDVSFATHDIYDYFFAGLIPLHELEQLSDDRRQRFFDFANGRLEGHEDYVPENLEAAFLWLASKKLPDKPFENTREDRYKLQEFITRLLDDFTKAVTPTTDGIPFVTIDPEAQYRIELLKNLTWYYVINKPQLAVAQEGQKKIIDRLFDELLNMVKTEGNRDKILNDKPAPVPVGLASVYRECETDPGFSGPGDEEKQRRAVCDFICSLTEDQAVDLYERITGVSVSRSSIFGAWFH